MRRVQSIADAGRACCQSEDDDRATADIGGRKGPPPGPVDGNAVTCLFAAEPQRLACAAYRAVRISRDHMMRAFDHGLVVGHDRMFAITQRATKRGLGEYTSPAPAPTQDRQRSWSAELARATRARGMIW